MSFRWKISCYQSANVPRKSRNVQFSKICRLTDSEKIAVCKLSANGVPVIAIQTTLQIAHGNTHSSIKSIIHNEVAKALDEFLDGLYELLEGATWYLRVLSNDSGEFKCIYLLLHLQEDILAFLVEDYVQALISLSDIAVPQVVTTDR